MKKNLRIGIIGCGHIFPMHAYSVVGIPNVSLVAVCDEKEDRARAAADTFNCRWYSSYKELIAQQSLDVVHICTPHYLHSRIAVYGMEHGVSVLTEKPMSIEVADARTMIQTASRTGKTLGVIFQNRYNPGSQLAKQVLESGDLGQILGARMFLTWKRDADYYAKSDWKGTWDKEGGGVIIDQAIHTFDLLCWLIAKTPAWVEANIANRAHPYIQVEDMAEGVIGFENGVCAAFYTMNYYSKDEAIQLDLHCEKGTVQITADRAFIELNDGRTFHAQNGREEVFSYGNVKNYWGVGHVKQIQDFYRSLQNEEQPFLNGEEAMKTMRVVCALYQSGKENRRVFL